MQEVHTGRPETGTAKGTIIDFEAARQKRAAGEKTQRPRSRMAPPSMDAREERDTARREQRIRKETDELINEILYGPGKRDKERAKIYAKNEEIERLAKEKGWEAVADRLWTRVGTFNTGFGRKYDYPDDPVKRKLPDTADTREQINARLSRIHIKPLSDQHWEEWERMREVDPSTLTQEEWQEWRRNPASLTQEAVGDLEAYQREIAPAKEWLDRFEEGERKSQWEKVAVPEFAKKLGLDPAALTPEARKTLVDYDPYAFECAQAAGLNPLTLTPEQQKELADFPPGTAQLAKALGLNPLNLTPEAREDLAWGERIITQAQKLGVDPGTLTSDERYDLRRYGRIRTPEERKEREEIEKTMTGMNPLTPEEWKKLIRTMSANVKRQEREKAAWIHERDPRYDPMTGDLLEPDEFPLSSTAEYYFDGKTRPRRFIPPDSPHLKDYKPLETDGEEETSEGDSRDRLVKRLLKAGFTEVEPTLMDKTLFEKTQWYRSLSPSEKMQFLQETMQEMTQERPWNKEESASAEFIKYLLALLFALLGVDVLEEEAKSDTSLKEAYQ